MLLYLIVIWTGNYTCNLYARREKKVSWYISVLYHKQYDDPHDYRRNIVWRGFKASALMWPSHIIGESAAPTHHLSPQRPTVHWEVRSAEYQDYLVMQMTKLRVPHWTLSTCGATRHLQAFMKLTDVVRITFARGIHKYFL